MKSGIPLGKLDCLELRSLIEENGFRLTDSRHLLDLVPFVLDEERTQIRSEVKDTFSLMALLGKEKCWLLLLDT